MPFLDHSLNPPNFRAVKATTFLQPDRIKPKFCHLVLAFHMHMHGLIPVAGVEENPIRTGSEHRGHLNEVYHTNPLASIGTRNFDSEIEGILYNFNSHMKCPHCGTMFGHLNVVNCPVCEKPIDSCSFETQKVAQQPSSSDPNEKALEIKSNILFDAFAYPFRMRGFSLILITTFLFYFPSWMHLPVVGDLFALCIWALMYVLFTSYCLSILRSSARGKNSLPEWPDPSFYIDEIILPSLKMTVLVFSFGILNRLIPKEWGWIVPILFLLFAPLSIMILAVSEKFLSSINPVAALYLLRVVWKEYLLYLIPFYLLLASIFWLATIPGPFTFAGMVIYIYAILIAMRILGLIYRVNRSKLDLSVP